jgi:hypothetical protein
MPNVADPHQGSGRRRHVTFGAAHASWRSRSPAASGARFSSGQKHTSNLGRADYQHQHEPILYGWRYGHISTGAAPATSRIHGTSVSARRPTCSRPYEARRSGRAGAPGAWTSCLSVCRFGLHPDGRAKAGRQVTLVEHDPKYSDVIVQRCSKGHLEIRHRRSSRPMV